MQSNTQSTRTIPRDPLYSINTTIRHTLISINQHPTGIQKTKKKPVGRLIYSFVRSFVRLSVRTSSTRLFEQLADHTIKNEQTFSG